VYSLAAALGDRFSLVRLLKVKAWTNAWRDFEYIAADVEKEAMKCYHDISTCLIDSSSGIEYTDTPGEVEKILTALAPNSRSTSIKIPKQDIAPLWKYPTESTADDQYASSVGATTAKTANRVSGSGSKTSVRTVRSQRRIKVGIVSSDFGVHPVATLIRGMVQFMDRRLIDLYCFSLHPSVSWWGENITNSAEHFVWLQNMNTQDAAESIAARGIEILIDLNGHTMNSGRYMYEYMWSMYTYVYVYVCAYMFTIVRIIVS
jgi:Glycosyl transferase family 41